MMQDAILCDTRCELGEGPFFCERRNTLFWFDILNSERHALELETGTKTVLSLPEMASAMAVIDQTADLIFTASGLWKHEIAPGAWSPVASIEADNSATRSNDARVHPSGAFWLGTMGLSAQEGAGAIYHFRQGVVTKLFDSITIPNAQCFSPDGKKAYFTDTMTAQLMVVELDAEAGLPSSQPRVLVDHAGKQGGLDGAVTDADGNIWVALWGASCVTCYAPDGTLLKTLKVDATQTSCPAFLPGGDLAVSTAWQGMDEVAKAVDRHAGKTFRLAANAKAKYEPRVLI